MNKDGLCKCGCGGKTGIARQNDFKNGYTKGEHVYYIRGHVKYNGGIARHSKGYVLIKKTDHPRADVRGYVFEHILVMEKSIGRHIKTHECVHHIDEAPNNNNLSNLFLCRDNAEHKTIHLQKRAAVACGNQFWRKCRLCKVYDDTDKMYFNPANNSYHHRACYKKWCCRIQPP